MPILQLLVCSFLRLPVIFCILISIPIAISCFNECLEEDHRVNRLEDSFLLWRTVCPSKLLSNVAMILLLNNCDILKAKLRSGLQVKKYLPSFGERSNDVGTVVKCTSS